jgi:glycerol uptake facilitator-like aquaporin
MQSHTMGQRLGAEFLGTAFLLSAIVGSGIMAEGLSGGNVALELLCNSTATGAILVVLITMLGPISGAHFNPAVTLAFLVRKEIAAKTAVLFMVAQIIGGIFGVWVTHLMFDETTFQLSAKLRTGGPQWFSEWVATFGLVATILLTLKARPSAIPMSVGLYVASAIWFTASTSFANPAVTIARGLSDTFAGIHPAHIPAFVVAQMLAAIIAVYVCKALSEEPEAAARIKITDPAE